MHVNRRALLASTAALAGARALCRLTFLPSALAAALPNPAGQLASRLAADPRRPQYHLLPAANWMNDPNGPIYWRGAYHMFYQYNPNGAYWGDMHWGHAVSLDMVHWRHLPIALAPTPGGPDAAGCFSGTALSDGDGIAVIYTGVVAAPESEATIRDGAHSLKETQCLAIGSGPDPTHWKKIPAPVLATPPPGLDVTGFRDPTPWRLGGALYLAVGSGIRNKGGAILLYRALPGPEKLTRWEYLHPLVQGAGTGEKAQNPVDSGDMWECPDFFPLGEKHVLIHSTGGKAYWQSGTLDPDALVFHPERSGVLDYGSYYAPKTQLDRGGRRILWGWIQEARPESEYRAAGWAGMMSLPRVLSLDANRDLRMEVATEVQMLRRRPQRLRVTGNEPADREALARMQVLDGCGEIAISFRRSTQPLEIALVSREAGSTNTQPWIVCRFTPLQANEMDIDGRTVPLGTEATPEVELRFFIDGSVIECFANRHGAVTKRFYYPGSSSPAIAIEVKGPLSTLSEVSMWQISPISRDRLTT
jgi:beta-fructofuranosidase